MNLNELVEVISVNTQSSIRIGAQKVIYFDPIEIKSAPKDADIVFAHGCPMDMRVKAEKVMINGQIVVA